MVLRSRVGKWERRTERERIGGTNSRRSDFDESRLAEEYDPTDEGEEKLGAYTAQKLMLKGKPGIDLAFPMIRSGSTRTPRTCSSARSTRCPGKLLRTSYYPKWKKVFSESKKARRLVPGGDPLLRRGREGELDADPDQGASTCTRCRANLFTKAWLESKCR